MKLLNNKTDSELLHSLLAEIAKAGNEIRCAQGDLNKANNRLNFLIAVANELIDRNKDQWT